MEVEDGSQIGSLQFADDGLLLIEEGPVELEGKIETAIGGRLSGCAQGLFIQRYFTLGGSVIV